MAADRTRLAAYRRALAASIRPGCVVADVGAGTGVMALLACELGARRAYAVDTSDAIAVAIATAEANGFHDRMVCVQADARSYVPPEPVDVAVGDLRGALPLFPGNLETMAHVKRRWLRPGGVLIPRRDTLHVALVRSPRLYEDVTGAWQARSGALDLRPALRWAMNQWLRARVRPAEVASAPRSFGVIEYGQPFAKMANALSWRVKSAMTVHGFAVWFDSELAPGISLSARPGAPCAVYSQGFFPFESPLALKPRDTVELSLAVQLQQEYLWTWNTRVIDRDAKVRNHFRQSSFLGQLIGPATLRKRAGPYRAPLSAAGRVTRAALDALASGRSVEETAQVLLGAHPDFFEGNAGQALAFAADISERFS